MDVGDDRQAAGEEDEGKRARNWGEEEEDEPGGRGAAASRGSDPAEPEDPVAPRIVGRASERGPRGTELHYFLVLTPAQRSPKRARKFEWKRRDELTTTAALAAAFDLLPAARRGSDPAGDGWVVGVTDARDGPDGREFRTRWFVWAQGERAPLSKRLKWRKHADFVNPTLADAFDDGLRAEAGVAEDESDDEAEAVPASAVPGFMAETRRDGGGGPHGGRAEQPPVGPGARAAAPQPARPGAQPRAQGVDARGAAELRADAALRPPQPGAAEGGRARRADGGGAAAARRGPAVCARAQAVGAVEALASPRQATPAAAAGGRRGRRPRRPPRAAQPRAAQPRAAQPARHTPTPRGTAPGGTAQPPAQPSPRAGTAQPRAGTAPYCEAPRGQCTRSLRV